MLEREKQFLKDTKLELHTKAKIEQIKQINVSKQELENTMKYLTNIFYKHDNGYEIPNQRKI